MLRAAVLEPPVPTGDSFLPGTGADPSILGHAGDVAVAGRGVLADLFRGQPPPELAGRADKQPGQQPAELAPLPSGPVELIAGECPGGLGMVLTFLPLLALFYRCPGHSGRYGLPVRIAFLVPTVDALPGSAWKSFLPLLLGFGCNVPWQFWAAASSELPKARSLTLLLIPRAAVCVPRRLPFWCWCSLAPGRADLVGAAGGQPPLLGLAGFVLHRFVFRNEHVPFITGSSPCTMFPTPGRLPCSSGTTSLGLPPKKPGR